MSLKLVIDYLLFWWVFLFVVLVVLVNIDYGEVIVTAIALGALVWHVLFCILLLTYVTIAIAIKLL